MMSTKILKMPIFALTYDEEVCLHSYSLFIVLFFL